MGTALVMEEEASAVALVAVGSALPTLPFAVAFVAASVECCSSSTVASVGPPLQLASFLVTVDVAGSLCEPICLP